MSDYGFSDAATEELPSAIMERAQAVATKAAVSEVKVAGAVDTVAAMSADFSKAGNSAAARDGLRSVATGAPQIAQMKGVALSNMAAKNAENASLARSSGEANAENLRLAKAAEFATQQGVRAAAKRVEADYENPNSMVSLASDQILDKGKKQLKIDSEIADLMAVPFWSGNPIKNLVDSFKIDQLRSESAGLSKAVNNAANLISKASNATSEAANIIKRTEQSLDAGSASRAYTIAANASAVLANSYDIAGYTNQVQLIEAASSGNKERVSALQALYAMDVSEVGKELQRAQISEYTAVRNARAKTLADSEQEKRDALTTMSKAYAAFTGNPAALTEAIVKRLTKEQQTQLVTTGIAMEATGTVAAGNNPQEAYNAIAASGFSPSAESGFKVAFDAIKRVVDTAPITVKQDKNPEAMGKWLNQKLLTGVAGPDGKTRGEGLATQWANAPEDQAITRAQPPSSLIKFSPELYRTPLYQTIIAPQVAVDKNVTLSFEQLMGQGMEAYTSGKLELSDLITGVRTYYQAAMTANMGHLRYMGLPPQTSYNIQVGSRKYDISKDEQIQQYITGVLRDKWLMGSTNKKPTNPFADTPNQAFEP